jgi:hypothetical protein
MADRTPDLMRRHARYAAHLADLADRDLFDPAASAELADSLTLADRGLTPAPARIPRVAGLARRVTDEEGRT